MEAGITSNLGQQLCCLVADFCLGTEDDDMPGHLVNISVIMLHLLHDGVMDGRASWSHGFSLLYGSLYCVQIYWFVVCHHLGHGDTCSMQGHFFWQSRYS